MKQPRWSIVYLGIMFSLVNGVTRATEITSCLAAVEPDKESMTINVTYDGGDHQWTLIGFGDPLRPILDIEEPCEISSISPDITFITCSDNSPSNIVLIYDLSSITNTIITIQKLNFPVQSHLYTTDSIHLAAFSNIEGWGSNYYCPAFSSPTPLSLLGNPYINIL